jgi:hypothetical protein
MKRAQTVSAAEAAAFVTSGMWLDYGTGVGQPDAFDRALGADAHRHARALHKGLQRRTASVLPASGTH